MATCQHCGAFVSLPFKCNYCGLELCPNCRLPPDHDCAWLDSWKSTSAPHAFVKMDRIHHPELWGPIRPGSRSFGDERSDPRLEELDLIYQEKGEKKALLERLPPAEVPKRGIWERLWERLLGGRRGE